jgi:hypothetical protein
VEDHVEKLVVFVCKVLKWVLWHISRSSDTWGIYLYSALAHRECNVKVKCRNTGSDEWLLMNSLGRIESQDGGDCEERNYSY